MNSALLSDLVDTSQRVGEHASRRTKIARMAEFLRGLAPAEIDIGVSYLAGVTRQGKRGIGWATIRDARPQSNVETSELTLIEVDATLDRIARSSGPARSPSAPASCQRFSHEPRRANRNFSRDCSSASCGRVRSRA